MPKRFTIAEAESLLPEIGRAMLRALEIKVEFDRAANVVQATIQKIMMVGGMSVDAQAVSRDRNARDSLAEQLKTIFEEVQSHGCLIKDLDTGLIDFPTIFEGREVYLCWKLGEKSIEFWHGVEEGFAGRKPIDSGFRESHQGDPLQ